MPIRATNLAFAHLAAWLVALCVTPPAAWAQSRPAEAPIADLANFPQDIGVYLDADAAAKPLLGDDLQRKLFQQFRRRWFAPWQAQGPTIGEPALRSAMQKLLDAPSYGPNARRRSADWAEAMADLADLAHYPNAGCAGITLNAADLRELPTKEPSFEQFDQPGLGYPFDLLQASSLPPNTPLRVNHRSRDGAWLYCDSPLGSGWVDATLVATVSAEMARSWQGGPLAAIVRDDVSVRTGGVFRFRARVGAVFLLAGQGKEGPAIQVAIADVDGAAVARSAQLAPGQAVPMPLPLTGRNVAAIGNILLGQPYGWGGLCENRDCSSTLRDLFAPFGLFLPRNSADQAEIGQVIPLRHLPPERREQMILRQGRPLLTLIRIPGHIMLYLGPYKVQAAVLHTSWGVHTRPAGGGGEGRHVVGCCAITGLQPGKEVPNAILPNGDLRNRIESMIILDETLLGP